MSSRPTSAKRSLVGADLDAARRLVAFIPLFERTDLKACSWSVERQGDLIVYRRPEYTDEIHGFFNLLVPPFIDTDYMSSPVLSWLEDPNFMEAATVEQLRTVLTWLARGERLCDGFWDEQIGNGNLVKALRRLQALLDC